MKASLKAVRKIIKEVLEDDYSARDEAISIYSDVFKEKNGIRPRHIDWETYSTEQIQAMLEKLYEEPGWGEESSPFNDDYDYEPQPHEADFYPPNAGTVDDEPVIASVRSGGRVHLPGQPDPVRSGMGRRR